jgi:L,D-peptidoglycan transpeptidase YkuD (ErfK/YbiS/YcfS/YnhG family)
MTRKPVILLLTLFGCAALATFLILRRQPAPAEKPAEDFKLQIAEMKDCRQLLLVTVKDWTSVDAQLRCFERSSSEAPWAEARPPIPANVGRSGLGWGLGLHGKHPSGATMLKREGDGRAPAGVFSLREIFGYATEAEARFTQFPYRQVTAQTEGIDDPNSRFYNRIIDPVPGTGKDWNSAETMLRPDGLYRWGVFVDHNWQQIPHGGSCIFLHIWSGPGRGTAGCTAMAEDQMESLTRWLDRDKHPLLVQLPEAEYHRLRQSWSLP